MVVNVPKGFDLTVVNLHPTAPLDMGTQMDSNSDKISLLSIPSGAEAKMGLEIRDEAQHADIVFLIPRNTGVGIKLEPR